MFILLDVRHSLATRLLHETKALSNNEPQSCWLLKAVGSFIRFSGPIILHWSGTWPDCQTFAVISGLISHLGRWVSEMNHITLSLEGGHWEKERERHATAVRQMFTMCQDILQPKIDRFNDILFTVTLCISWDEEIFGRLMKSRKQTRYLKFRWIASSEIWIIFRQTFAHKCVVKQLNNLN